MRRARFDVAVVGGGTAGLAAALAAARAGARTLLLERSDVLGGNAARAWVHTICGLYRAAAEGEALPAHAGLPQRFARALAEAGAAGAPERAGRVWVLPTRPPRLAAVADALAAREPRLEVWRRAPLAAARPPESSGAWRLLASAPEGLREASARVAVDASGDAALAQAAGAELDAPPPEALQHPSYVFRMTGVAPGALEGFGRLRVAHAVAGARRAGAPAGAGDLSLLARPGGAPDEAYLTLTLAKPPGRPYAPLDPAYAAALAERARRVAEEVAVLLSEARPEFAAARLLGHPRCVGVRETRRVAAAERVTREDVLEGRRRDDEVALSTWPIELWEDPRRARFEHPKGPASVPLGALVSRSQPALAAAGRCLSATRDASGALRVIGTALATGEAAGVAAALAADAGTTPGAIAPARVREHILAASEEGGAPA